MKNDARYRNKRLGLVIYLLMGCCAFAKVDAPYHFLEQVSASTFSENNESGKEHFIATLTEDNDQTDYTYDNVGRLLTVTQAGKTITRQYDNLGRLTQFTDTEANTLNYTYDAIGRLTELTYPDGKKVTYNYDANSRLTTVTDWAGRTTQYNYDAAGRLIETQRPNGTQQILTYGTNKKKDKKTGLLTQLTDIAGNKTLIDYQYNYNHTGQLAQQKGEPELDAPELLKPVEMKYDADNRLINYNGSDLDYDANGNLLTLVTSHQSLVTSYDSRNRLTEAGNTTYIYDAENRRIAIQDEKGTIQLVHNPNALLSQLLVRKTPDGKETYYVYGLGLLYQETDNQALYYHYDHQGNTLLLTDQNGQITDQFSYSPYGELISRNGTTDTPFQYNGRFGVMTDENGLLHMRARYYSPELKRFLNQDILLGNIADPLTLNRFAYVNGDPVNMIDPLGLIGWGLGINASGSVGVGLGATAGASAGAAFFLGPNPNNTQGSFGGYISYGAGAGSPSSTSIGHYLLGGGATIHAFFTNADNAEQLSQTTDTAFINIGFGIDISFSFSWGNGVGLVEVGAGPGGGLGIGHIQTTTHSGTLPVTSSK